MSAKINQKRSVPRVYGGGAMRGPALIGVQEYLNECGVDQGGEVVGVSIGSIVAALDTNGISTQRQRQVFYDDLSQIGGGVVLQALLLPHSSLPSPADLIKSPFRALRQLVATPLSLVRVFIGEVNSLIRSHSTLPAEELTGAANDVLRLLGGGLVDMVPVTRMLVDRLDLKPNKRLKIVAYDLLSRRPVVFQGEDYDLSLAIAASCSVPGMMRPVVMVHEGKLCLLVDGGVWHPHPGVVCEERGAIICKLIDYPGMGFVWSDRDGDFPVTVVSQESSLFCRLDENEVEKLVQAGKLLAKEGLGDAIASGAIATSSQPLGV